MENTDKSRGFEKTNIVYTGSKSLWSVGISKNDKMIAVGDAGGEGKVRLFSINDNDNSDDSDNNDKLTFNLEREVKLHFNTVLCLVFSDDDKYLLSCSDDGTIVLSDAKTLQRIKTFNGHSGNVYCVLFKSENEFVSCGGDNKIIVWDINSGNRIASVHTGNTCYSLALSPNKEIIVVGQGSGNIMAFESTVVDQMLKKMNDVPKKHSSGIWSLRFTPNGRNLVSFSSDKTIGVYEVSSSSNDNYSFRHLQTLTGHSYGIYGGAISPDGEIIASGSADSTIKLWDIKTGQCLKTIKSHADVVNQVAFSHSGHFLASVGSDKTLQITINDHAWMTEDTKDRMMRYLAKSNVFVPFDIRDDFIKFSNRVRFNCKNYEKKIDIAQTNNNKRRRSLRIAERVGGFNHKHTKPNKDQIA